MIRYEGTVIICNCGRVIEKTTVYSMRFGWVCSCGEILHSEADLFLEQCINNQDQIKDKN